MSQTDAATLTGDSQLQALGNSASECLYADVSGAGAGHNSAAIIIAPTTAGTNAAALQAAASNASHFGNTSYQQVTGIGDAAFSFSTATTTSGSAPVNHGGIVFVKGSNLVIIFAESSSKSTADIISGAQSIASKVAGQL